MTSAESTVAPAGQPVEDSRGRAGTVGVNAARSATVWAQAAGGTRLPAIARFWWVTALRGLVALTLALAIVVAGRGTARLVTFLALYWMTGGLLTLRLPWRYGRVVVSG